MVTRTSGRFLVALASSALLLAAALPAAGASRSFTLTAILYGDPDEKNALGSLELRLSPSYGDPEQYQAMGVARFGGVANGYTDLVITGGGAEISWGDPDQYGDPNEYGDPDQFGGLIVFRLATVIPTDLATRMWGDPDDFTATLYVERTPVGSGQLMFGRTR
jgi:hypothetical protein